MYLCTGWGAEILLHKAYKTKEELKLLFNENLYLFTGEEQGLLTEIVF